MDDEYQYECPSADIELLARVVSDLFPEQTQFAERPGDDGQLSLVIHYVAMRFGATARRIAIDIRFDPAALARYRAMPPRLHARSYAVLRAYVEATRSEEHTSELQSQSHLVCRLLLEKKK